MVGKLRTRLVTTFAMLLLVGAQQTAASDPLEVDRGELLRRGGSAYPRLVRLEHSGEANGLVLAGMTAFANGAGFAVIYASRDDGATFEQVGEVRDPEGADGKGMCCSTLYELPQQVGDMPAGTLLWAGNLGIGPEPEHRRSSIRVWRSSDQGRTWSFLSTIVQAPLGPGVWEPEFTVSTAGELVVFYSDDGDPKHDQKLVQMRSRDGRTWTDLRETVKHDNFFARPGMAGVRRLPDGTYVMAYEICNLDPVHLCTLWTRTSRDGWDYGDPYHLGKEIVTDNRTQPLATPTIAWGPGPGPNGRLLLGYQMLAHDNGGLAPGNGRTLLVNDNPADLSRGWREIASPVQISNNEGGPCRNYSPTALPTSDGRSVIHIATDHEKDDGPCEAFYATGPIEPGSAALPDVRPLDIGPRDSFVHAGR